MGQGGAGASIAGPTPATNGGTGGGGYGGSTALDIDSGSLTVSGVTRLDISATGGTGGRRRRRRQ